jgi:hypothetical protein
MPENPTVLRPDLQRLVDEGYVITDQGAYLILDNVPYVTQARLIERGALICAYDEKQVRVTGDHTVYFTGPVPFRDDQTSLVPAMMADETVQSIAGRTVQCRLSNKPDDVELMLANYYNKLTHYVRKISSYAQAIDPTVSASSTGSFVRKLVPSVFHYPNTAIARNGLDAYDAKLKLKKVSIVGVGGTGSYILDAIAKTPVQEIHLFDGDTFESHNAYRMPGTVDMGVAYAGRPKTEVFAQIYGKLRTGIVSHPVRIGQDNLQDLDGSDFVFLAIDHGPSRALIADWLVAKGIVFIDVGIGVDKVPEQTSLIGRARYTIVQPSTSQLAATLPRADDPEEALYNNIQLPELNALNAMLAVIRYKQYLGFFAEEVRVDSLKFVGPWNKIIAKDINAQNPGASA